MTDRKHLSIVIDSGGNPWGPFETLEEIRTFVHRKFPGQEQKDPDDPESKGWDVWVLHSPEE